MFQRVSWIATALGVGVRGDEFGGLAMISKVVTTIIDSLSHDTCILSSMSQNTLIPKSPYSFF